MNLGRLNMTKKVGEMPVNEHADRLSADQTLKLWRDYQRTRDSKLRDRLVLTFAPMVKYIVYRKIREMPARCEVDDFISCGLEALIRSIDRYDPDKGATLEQFAWTRIHGAVLDELRRHDWAPRSLRRAVRVSRTPRCSADGCGTRISTPTRPSGIVSAVIASSINSPMRPSIPRRGRRLCTQLGREFSSSAIESSACCIAR